MLTLSQPGVSKHLRVLREAGLVDVRADGRVTGGFLSEPDAHETVPELQRRCAAKFNLDAPEAGSERER